VLKRKGIAYLVVPPSPTAAAVKQQLRFLSAKRVEPHGIIQGKDGDYGMVATSGLTASGMPHDTKCTKGCAALPAD